MLPRIAEVYGIDLVADAYWAEPKEGSFRSVPSPPDGQELTLYSVLNRWALRASRWTREGEVFHFRHHRWYHVRHAEIPRRVVSEWAARIRRSPSLSVDDLTAMATQLNDAQLNRLPVELRSQGVWLGPTFIDRLASMQEGRAEILRAYALLTPQQRLRLARGEALPASEFSRQAQRLLGRHPAPDEPAWPDHSGRAARRPPAQPAPHRARGGRSVPHPPSSPTAPDAVDSVIVLHPG